MCNIIIRYFTIWEGGVGSLMIVQMAPLHSSSAPCETLFLKTFQFSSQLKSFFGDTAFSYPSFPHLVIFTSHRALTRKALFLPICPGANNPNSQNTWFLLLLLLLRANTLLSKALIFAQTSPRDHCTNKDFHKSIKDDLFRNLSRSGAVGNTSTGDGSSARVSNS